jgi:multidrug efflux pump subunit AcrB
MQEVSGPIIATTLTLAAIFIPVAFVSGLTGQFYEQFALTIAISVFISAFNSLTLSPAMAAKLLHAPDARRVRLCGLRGRFFATAATGGLSPAGCDRGVVFLQRLSTSHSLQLV